MPVDADCCADEVTAEPELEPTDDGPFVGVLGAEQVTCPDSAGVVGLLSGVDG